MKRVITITFKCTFRIYAYCSKSKIDNRINDFKKKAQDVTIKQTGEGEQQAETGAFLGKALVIALMLILFILVLQFNSSK